MKKLLALTCTSALALSLVACGTSSEPAAVPETDDDSAPAVVYTVGISQLVQHDALDAATLGFQDALSAALPGQVKFNYQNASGDIPMCSTIANQFIAEDVDLILANATPALQATTAATIDIPVLGTAVTEYGVALGITNFDGLVGGNVSGTSDLAPLLDQAAMVAEWAPEAETVGLLYCSAEANSQYQVDVVKAALEEMGYDCTLYSFSDSNDLAMVTEMAVASSDIIYVPTDNTVAANTGIIDNICRPAGVPVIAGEEGIATGCGVATLSISYYDLGVTTGEMAAKILTGEANVSDMPIQYAGAFTPKYNAEIMADLGLTVPSDSYVAIEG